MGMRFSLRPCFFSPSTQLGVKTGRKKDRRGREIVMGGDQYFSTIRLLAEYEVWCTFYTTGNGIGPKKIRRTFSFPITSTSSCMVQ